MSWDRKLDEPVALPNGKTATTLRHAAQYVMGLPNAEQQHAKWQVAMQILIDAAEQRGPLAFARMAMSQAIHRNEEPRLGPGKKTGKGTRWRRR